MKNKSKVGIFSSIGAFIQTISKSVLIFKKGTWKTVFMYLISLLGTAAILLASFWIFNAISVKNMQKAYEQQQLKIETQKFASMNARLEQDPIVDSLNVSLMNFLNADRVMTAEFHDGVVNSGRLDFVFFDERHETVNEAREVDYITVDANGVLNTEFVGKSTQSYSIISYLKKNRIFIGTTEEFAKVDKRYAHRMMENGTVYAGIIYIESLDRPLAMINVSWQEGNEQFIPSEDRIRRTLEMYAIKEAIQLTFK